MAWYDAIDRKVMKRGSGKKGLWDKVQVVVMMPPGTPQAQGMGGMGGGVHTGFGPDGHPQPDMPAMMDMSTNPPTVIHEDEKVIPFPGGKHVVPSPLTPPSAGGGGMAPGPMPNTVVPTSPQAQQQMKQMEMLHGLPGRQAGGTIYENPLAGGVTSGPAPIHNVQLQQPQIVANPLAGGVTRDPAPIHNVQLQQPQIVANPLAGGVTRDPLPMVNVQASAPSAASPAPTSAPATTLTPSTNTQPYSQGRAAGYEQIRQVAQGTDPYMENVTNRAMQNYDATQAANTTAQAQRMAQTPGMTEGGKNLSVAMLGRDAAVGRADLAGKLAETQTGRMYDAAKEVAAQDRWQQSFDFDKQRYGDSKAWTDFEYTAQYGSDADVIAAYKAATGKDLDPSAVAEIRGYARTIRGQTATAGQIANDAAALGLSTAQMQAMISDINSGVPLDAINGRYGVTLSEDQYDSIATRYRQTVQQGELTLESLRTRVGDERYNAVQNRIATGATYDQVRGDLMAMGLNEAQALNAYNSMGIERAQKISAGAMQLDMLRNQLGDQRFASITNRIAAGASVEQINAEFGAGTINNMQYAAMYAMTPQAIRRYEFDKTFGLQERALNIQEASAASKAYWDGANRFNTYTATRLGVTPESFLTSPVGSSQMQEAVEWYKATYGKEPTDPNSKEFREWAQGEWAAATDKRLTNLFDAMAYAINTSDQMPDALKPILVDAIMKSTSESLGVKVEWDKDGNPTFVSAKDEEIEAARKAEMDSAIKVPESGLSAIKTKDTWHIPQFQQAYEQKKPVLYNGQLYTVTAMKEVKKLGWGGYIGKSNGMKYTLMAKDGTIVQLETDSNGGIFTPK